MRYIALLRGINVGGNTMIKMAELKIVFEDLGFSNVTSYVNSGNIGFDAATSSETTLTSRIEKAIEKRFEESVPVMIRTQPAVSEVFANNPFDGQFENHKEMHVLFMKEEMSAEKQEQLLSHQTDDERFVVRGREIYCHLRLGVADSVLGKGLIDRKLKVPITARNWRTVEKLSDL